MRGAIYYSETWPVSTNSLDSMGSVTLNDKPGSFAEFHFIGNHISYFARRAPNMGIVDVYLDDQLVLNDFDLYSASVINKALIYRNDNLENTVHTLRIENTGLKSANANGSFVNIDYLVHRLGDHIVMPAQEGEILPVKLLSFDGRAEQNKVRLTWKTANEVNNSHFEISRVEPNNTFTTIGRVNAKTENSSGPNDYSLYDLEPKNGKNYYQLKQYDIDGKFTLSKIISVDFGTVPTFSVYPNPVKNGESIKITAINLDTKVDIQLIDINSRVIAHKSFDRVQDKIEWQTVGLKAGIYLLLIKTKSGQSAHKVIVNP
jgi:hypothetical protein